MSTIRCLHRRKIQKEKEKLKVVSISPFRLSSLLRLQRDPKQALQLFLNPNPQNPKPFRYSLLSYDLIISKLGRAKMLDEMEQIIGKMKHETRFMPKESIFCNVITFYGRARLPDQALRIFNQISSFRCQRTVKSLNTLLNALLGCREFEKMREIFINIGKYECPDACTYNTLIRACCLNDDLGGAWNLFDEMRRRGIQPDVVTFGTLINGLCANMELDKAFRLKEDMSKVFRIRPNGFVYVSLIKGLCRVNKLDLALKLKDEMLKEKVKLDSAVFSALIGALFKTGRKGEVCVLLEEMKKNGCKPDTITYNAMIFGFCNEKDFDSAFDVLNEMDEKRFKPDVISYNVIIGGLCKEGQWNKANELFEDMPRRQCSPDVVTYRTLFDGLCDGMQLKEAALIFDEMAFKGYVPRTASINKFVGSLVQEGDMKLLWMVLNSLAKRNVADVGIWRSAIDMVCEEEELSNASKFVDTLVMA